MSHLTRNCRAPREILGCYRQSPHPNDLRVISFSRRVEPVGAVFLQRPCVVIVLAGIFLGVVLKFMSMFSASTGQPIGHFEIDYAQ
ncbi:MAG: hypothetical protein WBL40_16875, partial [Terrimicrobiaceae bacterium]